MTKYEINSVEVETAQIPSIITSQVKEIAALDRSVKNATAKAEVAMDSANRAWGKSTGLFHKKEAIESLQSAQVDLAEGQIASCEAQKISFEYQKKLGQITQYLFGLGVTNLAANRTVVRELEMKLKGASEEEINDLARQEILTVVKQLKAQEDIMIKQADLAKKAKQQQEQLKQQQLTDEALEKKIAEQSQKSEEQDRKITEQSRKAKEQDRRIAEQSKKAKEQDHQIAEQSKKAKEQDSKIAEQSEKLKEHDRMLADQFEKNKEQDRSIVNHEERLSDIELHIESLDHSIEEINENLVSQKKTDEELGRMLKQQESEIDAIKNELIVIKESLQTKANKSLTYVSLGIATVSLVLAMVQFFI